jgi:hypothetical protein
LKETEPTTIKKAENPEEKTKENFSKVNKVKKTKKASEK